MFSGPTEGVRRGTITNVDNLMNKYDAAEMIKKELGDDVEENHVHQFILVMQLRYVMFKELSLLTTTDWLVHPFR